MTAHSDSVLPRRRALGFGSQVLPALSYTALIFYTGLVRMRALPEVGFIATDKLLHALAFGGLALLAARALHWLSPNLGSFKKLLWGAFIASFLGMLLEVCQAFTSYRSSDPLDWLADTVGALLAALMMRAILQWVPRRAHG